MIYAGVIALSSKDKAMSSRHHLELRYQPDLFVDLEFTQFLNNLAEPFDFQFKTCAFSGLTLVKFPRARGSRIPLRKIAYVNYGTEHFLDRSMYDLRELNDWHGRLLLAMARDPIKIWEFLNLPPHEQY